MPKSKGELEERLIEMDGVVAAAVEAYCCEEGRLVLYAGIQERGTPPFEFRQVAGESVEVPDEVMEAYGEFASALARAAAAGDVEEDLTQGHSLMRNAECREAQLKFAGLAARHTATLKAALERSGDTGVRAMAAYILGYAENKRGVVDDLQGGLRDPEQEVRATSARALRAIAVLARDKEKGILIRATWFVEMLNSVALGDRLEGSRTLNLMFDELTEGTMAQIRERALPSLYEMARWRHLAHALPAYLLLGKVAGVAAEEVEAEWEAGRREEMLKRIEAQLSPKKK
ncbi:MAG: hypothetical protein C0504_08040 [Candidatus Solibacter sp.]|nr:hypothetical protein [Candidatus Solibacter sp.]